MSNCAAPPRCMNRACSALHCRLQRGAHACARAPVAGWGFSDSANLADFIWVRGWVTGYRKSVTGPGRENNDRDVNEERYDIIDNDIVSLPTRHRNVTNRSSELTPSQHAVSQTESRDLHG